MIIKNVSRFTQSGFILEKYKFSRGDIRDKKGKLHKDVIAKQWRFRLEPFNFDAFIDNFFYVLFSASDDNKLRFNIDSLEFKQRLYEKYLSLFNSLKLQGDIKAAKKYNGFKIIKYFDFNPLNTCLQYYSDRGWPLEEAKNRLIKRQQTWTLETLQEKGLTLEEAKEKQLLITTKCQETLTSRPDYEQIKKSRGNAQHPEWYLNKINKDTNCFYTLDEARQAVFDKQSNAAAGRVRRINEGVKYYSAGSPLYWINWRGYSEEAAKVKAHEIALKCTFSLVKCIAKYGEIEGQQIWQARQDKWQATLNAKSDEEKKEILIKKCGGNVPYSRESILFFDDLIKFCKLDILSNKLHYKEQEYYLYDNERKKIYFYDFCLRTEKIIIEYNGSHCHPNPTKLNTEEKWNAWTQVWTKQGADVVKEYDRCKIELAERNGFTVFTIFDTEDKDEFKKMFNKYLQEKTKCLIV
jgi:very-short-patch-repair endonuclease